VSRIVDASRLPDDWSRFVEADELARVMSAVRARRTNSRVFPEELDTFRALHLTPVDAVKVVILGQDPYHGEGQAHGLAFSVRAGTKTPPSLRNIRKELEADLGRPARAGDDLTSWAEQGVLLLNATLTVSEGEARSHADVGWEHVTDALVRALSTRRSGLVFLPWGTPAQKKAAFVAPASHLVLKAPHPSPLSAHRGFFGCRHFSQADAYLTGSGRSAIAW